MEGLDRILVYELSENLRREQIELLSEKDVNAKNILIYDYLAGNNSSIDSKLPLLNLKIPILEQIVHARYDNISFNGGKYFQFMTPKKALILQQYKKSLSEELSDKFLGLGTKRELKQLYCLDELYARLNKNRAERVDLTRELSSAIDSSIELYANQILAREMQSQIAKFWELANQVDYSKISLEQFRYLKSHSGVIVKYGSQDSQDFEIKEKIGDSKKMILELNRRINKGIEDSLTRIKSYYKGLDKKDFISFEEFKDLKVNETKLSELEVMLGYLKDSRVGNISREIKKHSRLAEAYVYFCNNRHQIEHTIGRQIRMNRRINRITLKSTFSLLQAHKRNKIMRYIAITESNLSEVDASYENRYIKREFEDERRELSNDFKSLESPKNWLETLSVQTKTPVKEGFLGYFWGRRINRITNLLDSLNQFQDRLKTARYLA
jgi:hypothetical protein